MFSATFTFIFFLVNQVDQNSLLAVHTNSPDATIAVPWPPVPVYVELGELFLGDRLLSYGGALRFKVEEEGGEALPPDLLDRFPLVRLYGPNGIVLDYFEVILFMIKKVNVVYMLSYL